MNERIGGLLEGRVARDWASMAGSLVAKQKDVCFGSYVKGTNKE
jgi:hypothetical protein